MATTIIQPSSADAYILNTSATTNFGTAGSLNSGRDGSGNIYRSLIKFDLSSIPSSEVVISATLGLRLLADSAGYDVTWEIYQILLDWNEAQATWNARLTGTNWNTAGAMGAGDINPTAIGTSGTISNSTSLNTEISISLNKNIIQDMRLLGNYGFLLKTTSETSNTLWSLYSREHATTAYRPKLTVVSEQKGGGSVAMYDYAIF